MASFTASTLRSKELRKKLRQRTLLTGVGAYLDGTTTFDCSIRDLSHSGGRIRVGRGVPIPGTFHLVNVRDGVAYEAKVAWRKDGDAGLRWTQVISLQDETTPLNHLRRYLLEKAPR